MPGFTPGGLAPLSLEVPGDSERLQWAESDVRDYCRWHIAPEIVTLVDVDGSDHKTHVLPTRRLVSVADVTLAGQPLTEGVHFDIDHIGILTRIDGGRFRGRLRLSMRHGYTEIPPSVTAVILELVQAGKSGESAEMRAGPFSVIGARPGLTSAHHRTLSRYALEPGIC